MVPEKVLTEKPEAISPQGEQFNVKKVGQPERRSEQLAEQKGEQQDGEGRGTAERATISTQSIPASASDSELAKREKAIEKIMARGLEESYLAMSPLEQQNFKTAGESVAKQINVLLGETKIKIVKIINLIRGWLKMLPGVNTFFLEQETKLKVDEILQLKKGGE
jgi:hypothetical protein